MTGPHKIGGDAGDAGAQRPQSLADPTLLPILLPPIGKVNSRLQRTDVMLLIDLPISQPSPQCWAGKNKATAPGTICRDLHRGSLPAAPGPEGRRSPQSRLGMKRSRAFRLTCHDPVSIRGTGGGDQTHAGTSSRSGTRPSPQP